MRLYPLPTEGLLGDLAGGEGDHFGELVVEVALFAQGEAFGDESKFPLAVVDFNSGDLFNLYGIYFNKHSIVLCILKYVDMDFNYGILVKVV